jgi:hypothetical protein
VVCVEAEADDAIGVRREAIVAFFVGDVMKDQQAAGHADSQPEDVERGVAFAFEQVAPGDAQVVAEHSGSLWLAGGLGRPALF